MFFAIFELVVNIFEEGMILLLYRNKLESRGKKLPFQILCAGILAAVVSLLNAFDTAPYITTVVMGVLDLLYALFLFSGSVTKRILWGLVPTLIFAASNYLAITVIGLIMSEASAVGFTPIVRFEAQLLYMFLDLALFLTANFVKTRHEVFLPIFQRIVMIVLVLICIFTVSVLIRATLVLSEMSTNVSYMSAIASGALFIICLGIMFLFSNMATVY